MPTYTEKLIARMDAAESLLCVGLDPVDIAEGDLAKWSIEIIAQTHQYVCAFKPNLAFYEAEGQQGIAALEETLEYLRSEHPDIPVIGDAKRGDISSTSEAHCRYLFDRLGFDAVTLNPYLGYDALAPFIERKDRGCVIVCRTSNPGADDFQMIDAGGQPLWERILRVVTQVWNQHQNCSAVIGATRPTDLTRARKIAGSGMFFLVPGIVTQGGDLTEAIKADTSHPHSTSRLILNSSRSITNSLSPSQTAENLRFQIRNALTT